MNSTSTRASEQFSEMPSPSHSRGGNAAIGAAILSVFGTLWLAMACANDARGTTEVLAGIVICGVILFSTSIWAVQATKHLMAPQSAAEKAHRDRVFRNVNIAQWVAIPVMIAILNVMSLTQWIVPGIIFVVGVHFIPLARLFKCKEHLVIAAIFIVIAVVGPWLVPGGPASSALPFAAGVTLWITTLVGLRTALATRV